jgi:hypothetical protein
LKTNGNIVKFRLKNEWEIAWGKLNYTIIPYGQMTYFDFNDAEVGKFNSVGGDFFIYKMVLSLGIKFWFLTEVIIKHLVPA